MPWNGRDLSQYLVDVNGMAAALTQKAAAMFFKMPDEVNPLHAENSGWQPKPLANDLCAAQFLLCEQAIGFEHQAHGLLKVLASFVEGIALRVRSGKFFDKSDIAAFGCFLEDCCEFKWHGSSVFRIYQGASFDA